MPLTDNQKLKYIEVILEGCTDEELEPVLVEVAVEFLKDLQETKNDR